MIFNISDEQFKQIMENPKLHLPIRWGGINFESKLVELFNEFRAELNFLDIDAEEIKLICDYLLESIQMYHDGFPSRAFDYISIVMKRLMKRPLNMYQKSGFLYPFEEDRLYLFRLRNVNDNASHLRKDIFHVPASARSMISTCRYSIAGYPSLYLTTSINLGLEEIANDHSNTLVSRYKVIRQQPEINIRVLELGIKPQDFYENERYYHNNFRGRTLAGVDLTNQTLRSNYLRWYPLIAACSFIRANKNTPFSSEYIIPQLLMQWVRTQIKRGELMGIRYFSCASVRASDMGFDYVFPVSNTDYENNYCSVLRESFLLTNPVYIKEYDCIKDCERELIHSNDLDRI